MNRELVEKVVNAVLYEGYILYPYRASSKKNRQRFTFGRIYPEVYAAAQEGREPALMQTQCLLRDESKDAAVQISVRFLHPMAREVGRLAEWPVHREPEFEVVSEISIGGKRWQTWHEAVERAITLPQRSLGKPISSTHSFQFPESRSLEPLREADGRIAGVLLRRQNAMSGVVEFSAEPLDETVSQVTVRIRNQTPVPPNELENQDAILMRIMASTHTIIHTEGGSCLSLFDPPAGYEEGAKACKNIGAWPVLLGEEEKHESDAILSSPIILYDYPKIAPESAGDLYDGLEIDEILTLRIQTMTDEEKAEMREIDPHARRILERTEMMPDDHLLQMHGTMREAKAAAAAEDFFNPKEKRRTITVHGVELKVGDRVRIQPKRRADAFDMMLANKIGIIEAIEEDVQDEVHLALVLEDDPGRELGMARQPGHRFFYGADEVAPA